MNLKPASQVSFEGCFMNLTKFGSFIVSLREEAGITQTELAKKIGVKVKLVAMWEKGICPPKADKILDLASALAVQPMELLLSKRISANEIHETCTEDALGVYSEICAYQIRMEVKYRRMQLIVSAILAITLGVFLVDCLSLVLFLAIVLPILAAVCFISCIVSHLMFRHTNKKSSLPIVVGLISFFVFASILCLFIFAFWIGGPVPN